jgi:hypothetical protein
MIVGGTRGDATAAGFPAPGSSVPGAPPPLKRPLTPADGVLIASSTSGTEPADAVGRMPAPPRVVNASGSPLLAAAAMVGIAAGLELAALLGGRSAWRGRHKPPRC